MKRTGPSNANEQQMATWRSLMSRIDQEFMQYYIDHAKCNGVGEVDLENVETGTSIFLKANFTREEGNGITLDMSPLSIINAIFEWFEQLHTDYDYGEETEIELIAFVMSRWPDSGKPKGPAYFRVRTKKMLNQIFEFTPRSKR